MVIHSRGYKPDEPSNKIDEDFFVDSLPFVLNHQNDILSNRDYFFSSPGSFSFASWPYLGGGGPLYIGFLLLGWNESTLIENCQTCTGDVLLCGIGFSPLSGSGSCWGVCLICKEFQKNRTRLKEKMLYFMDLRSAYPIEKSLWIEEDGFEFCWGGNGLKPAQKKNLISKPLAEPVDYKIMVQELMQE